MGEEYPENLARSVPDSIRGDHLTDAIAVLADIGIDQAIGSGALDGVPIIGALMGIYRAGREVSGVLYMRKVARFLEGIANLSKSDREAFADGLYARGEAVKFGETILLLLEKADELDKPSLIARIFVAHVRGAVDYSTFLRLSLIVNRCIFSDLQYLRNLMPGVQPNQTVAESLFSAGLLTNIGFDGGGADLESEPSGTRYCLNEFGEKLVDLL
jgi:hypothetical protein